jgi:hypothetical protein
MVEHGLPPLVTPAEAGISLSFLSAHGKKKGFQLSLE